MRRNASPHVPPQLTGTYWHFKQSRAQTDSAAALLPHSAPQQTPVTVSRRVPADIFDSDGERRASRRIYEVHIGTEQTA